MHATLRASSSLLLLALVGLFVTAAPGPARADEEAPPGTVAVERGTLQVTIDLSATFVPQDAAEIKFEPKTYGGGLDVEEAVGPGPVLAGQVLVRFDAEGIEDQLRARRRDMEIARKNLERKQSDYRATRESAEIRTEQMELKIQRAVEGLERFLEIDKPTRIARSVYSLQGARNRIQDTVEELEQLVKMYEADELTEETEAIVIRRARRNLERSRQSLAWTEQSHETLVTITLPRQQRDIELGVRLQKIELAKFRVTLSTDLYKARLELEKVVEAVEKQEEALRELEEDRESLRLRAPYDGYAVPGRFAGGKWADVGAMRAKLVQGGSVKARQVLYTILKPGHLDLRLSLQEKDLLRVRSGMPVTVRPAIDGAVTLEGAVEELLPVGSGGKHEVRVRLEPVGRPLAESLMPGQSGQAKIIVSSRENVLHVPANAVKKVDGEHRVWVWKDGRSVAQAVQVGLSCDGRTEILEGLGEGDSILAKPPEEK